MARTNKPSSALAGRIPFPSLLKSTSGTDSQKSAPSLKTTLISSPLPISNVNATKKENLVIKPRVRSDSTASVETIKPAKPRVITKVPNRKRARVESATTAENEAAPRTRQRLSSMSKSEVGPQSVQDVFKKIGNASSQDATIRISAQNFQTKLRIPSNYRPAPPAPVISIGRSQPAAAVVTNDVDMYPDIPDMYPDSDPDDSSFVLSVPATSTMEPATPRERQSRAYASKSPEITRNSHPPIPSRWDSNAFPVMKPGLLEYHNRFRDAELARPKKELSTRIIPDGLLPPPAIYEPEDDDDFDEGDFHITPPLTDFWGNILEVGARHLEMSILLEERNFIEFWDLDHTDIVHVGVPAYLHFTLKVDNEDAAALSRRAIPPRPDFRCIDITCESFEYHVKGTPKPSPEYIIKYYGATVTSGKTIDPAYGLSAGILLKRKWGKMFPAPNVSSSYPSPPNSDSGLDDDDSDSADKTKDEQKKGWFLKMWVPIPIELFRKKESRAFRLKAAAWLGDERSGGILSAETDMVLSHLRSHREMEKI